MHIRDLLLCPWQRCRSIVMSMSVSISLEPHTQSLPIFLCMLPTYGRGLILVWQGDEIPREGGNFGGCPGHSRALAVFAAAVSAVFTAKGIIQSPIMSCSRSHHSVCQASANRNPENSKCRLCSLLARNGVMGVHSVGEVYPV